VKISDCISDRIPVTSGVPQGSALGPTLFLMFVNDICDVVSDLNVTMKLFADDAKMYRIVNLTQDCLKI
jgi:hypothetical protein